MKSNKRGQVIGLEDAEIACNFREDPESFMVSLGQSMKGSIAVDKNVGNVLLDEFHRQNGFVGAIMSPLLVDRFSLYPRSDQHDWLFILEFDRVKSYVLGSVSNREEKQARVWVTKVNGIIDKERAIEEKDMAKESQSGLSSKPRQRRKLSRYRTI